MQFGPIDIVADNAGYISIEPVTELDSGSA